MLTYISQCLSITKLPVGNPTEHPGLAEDSVCKNHSH